MQRIETEEIAAPIWASRIRYRVAQALARSDPVRAGDVAEAIESASDRIRALVDVAGALPTEKRALKLAFLARAARHVKDANSQYLAAEVAEQLYELGEHEQAKHLFAESVRLKPDIPARRVLFTSRLTHFDLPAALAIAREFSAANRNSGTWVYWNIALRLAADAPAEAERVLRLLPQEPGRPWLHPAIAWKMATTDPARARRLVDEAQRYYDHPQMYLWLALGLKAREPVAAGEAFQTALGGIDRLMKEGPEYASMRGERGVLLPLIEQIDPDLVPEVFWRAVATRPPIGNPRTLYEHTSIYLVILLGWYNHEVAAALFEPIRTLMEQTDDRELVEWGNQFLGWSIFDPRAAVARLEQVPVTTELQPGNFARERVAEILGLSYEDRWRKVWSDYSEMRGLFDRDLR